MEISLQTLLAVLVGVSLIETLPVAAAQSDKIRIDPNTKLYVSRDDGRVRVFHGLAYEAPTNDFLIYSQQQMDLMKTVTPACSLLYTMLKFCVTCKNSVTVINNLFDVK